MNRRVARIGISLAAVVGIGLSILVICGVGWLVKIESFPVAVIPVPAMPRHNAFDAFVASGKLLVRPNDIAAASAGGSRDTIAQKAALVSANSAALAKFIPALSKPYVNPPVRSIEQTMPYYGQFRNFARLLRLKSEVEAAQGQWQDSEETALDAVRLGSDIPHGTPILGELVGISCEAIGRRSAWPPIDHLSADEARKDIIQLQGIQANEVSLSDVFLQEKWYGQACLLEFGRKDFYKSPVGTIMLHSGLYNYSHYMDQLIESSRLPYRSRPASPPIPHDMLSAIIAPVFAGVGVKYTDNETQNQLMLVSLALQAYKADHAAYPNSLSQLVPAYLKSVPDDPFANAGPLRYHRTGSTYILYSVGPDGKDDGGKAILNISSHYSERFKKMISDKPNRFVEADSKGDIVAGVNIY